MAPKLDCRTTRRGISQVSRYLYLNTTAVDSHHPISRVFMRSRPPTEATCVTFWFSGRGFTGKLNMYRFTKETALRDPLVSVRTPAKEGQWIARRVPISSRNRWNLVFEGVATAGVPENSGIMIDDIEFSDGECPPYGYYLLFESPGTKGNKTTLTLREPLLYQCVSFWYFLPKLQKSVALYAQDDLISDGQGVWKRYQWDETVQMAIRSTKRFDCGNQSITIERVCDFVKDCANGDDERNCGQCDFSDGLCGWKAEGPLNRGTTAWRRQRMGEVDGSPTTGAYDKPTGRITQAQSEKKTSNGHAPYPGCSGPSDHAKFKRALHCPPPGSPSTPPNIYIPK
ncbi:hypothetical protein HPB51_013468 [Rhipicephalus microplus]|uniref:MAM domain-containing protein n=1 Tax=Rhipicephalus microplus TaxID=6941 RepID=A0A9J6DUF7_RHIMP|nr:hypothetical protein HPB51_013468 [Rhipicephalus microplus]